jgi:hypothetical protein
MPSKIKISGLKTEVISDSINGWFIWVVGNKNFYKQDSGNLSLDIYRKCIFMPKDSSECNIDKINFIGGIYLGGIYITHTIDKIGQINFYVAGVLTQKNNKWYVTKFNEGNNGKDNNQVKDDTTKITPTPIKRGDKDKQESKKDKK